MTILTPRAVRERTGPEVYGAAKAAGILTVAGLATGLSNLAFNIVVARGSGADRYGGIGTLLSLVTVASFLALGIGYAVARRTAIHELHPRLVLRGAARSMVPWFACLVPLLIAVGPTSDFLRLSSGLPVAIALGVVLTMLVGSLATGVLIGCRRFRLVAGLNMSSALTRVGLGAVLPRFFDATDAALVATLIPVAMVCVGAMLLVVRISQPAHAVSEAPPTNRHDAVGHGLPRDSLAGAIGSMALWAVWAAPLVAARHNLASADSGRFAAAQVLSGSVLFIVAPVTMAFFPTISKHRDGNAVVAGMVISASLALLGSVGLVMFGPLFMTHVYGAQFSTSPWLFLEFGLSATSVAMATFALWASRARYGRRSRVTVIALVALALEATAGGVFSPGQGALAVAPFGALFVAAMAALLMAAIREGGILPVVKRLTGARVASING